MPPAYDPQATLLYRMRGTVLPRVWPMVLITMGLSLALCFAFEPLRAAVKLGQSEGPKAQSTPVDRQLKVMWHLFHDAEVFLTYATTFLTFILGFFNSVAFSRWWKFRELTGVVLGRSSDTAVMVAAHITEGPEEEVLAARRDLCRLLLLALELHLQDAHQHEDVLEGRVDGITTAEEFAALKAIRKGRYSAVYGWILHRLDVAIRADLVHESQKTALLMGVQANVSMMRGACADVKMYQNQQIPLPYVSLLPSRSPASPTRASSGCVC
jgi:predicted membrane chloride channel (bestrophin family)